MNDRLNQWLFIYFVRIPNKIQDINRICVVLRPMGAFGLLRDSALRSLCRVIRYERHDANDILYWWVDLPLLHATLFFSSFSVLCLCRAIVTAKTRPQSLSLSLSAVRWLLFLMCRSGHENARVCRHSITDRKPGVWTSSCFLAANIPSNNSKHRRLIAKVRLLELLWCLADTPDWSGGWDRIRQWRLITSH